MNVFEGMKQDILATGATVFRIALYKDGVWQEEMLIPVCPCVNCYSVSKSFTATAIGIAEDMGLLSVEDNILQYFRDELPEKRSELLEQVKIKHLLTQTMGNKEGFLFEHDKYTHNSEDWVNLIFSTPLSYVPGEVFVYSNTTYYLLSCIVHKASGLALDMFLRKYLFSAMDIHEFAWETCPRGEIMGATGLYLSTKDMAKLGVLYMNNGIYNGRRILSEQWVKDATTMLGDQRYGYSFWGNDIGFSCLGAHNQAVLVVPGENLVFAAHSFTDDIDFLAILKNNLK